LDAASRLDFARLEHVFHTRLVAGRLRRSLLTCEPFSSTSIKIRIHCRSTSTLN
jgi:hypothetical protein